MKRLFAIFSFGAFISTMVSCTSVLSHKDTILPNRPMVYSMGVRLMDVNWIDQELCRIPLLIEETRQGKRITKVRVEPTGDVRLPGRFDDKACRWTLESCNAMWVDKPYTLRLRLSLLKYSGHSQQQLAYAGINTTIDYGVSPMGEWDAVIEVHRYADSTFDMQIVSDNISKLQDIEPHQYMKNPGMLQQTLDLQLQSYVN